MGTARSGLAAAAPSNGKLYAIGGFGSASVLSTCEEYDPGTDTWTVKTPMGTAKNAFAAAVPGNAKLYAIGGNNGGPLSTCEEYTPSIILYFYSKN